MATNYQLNLVFHTCFRLKNLGGYSSKSTTHGVKRCLISAIVFLRTTLDAPQYVMDVILRGYRTCLFAEYSPRSPCFLQDK